MSCLTGRPGAQPPYQLVNLACPRAATLTLAYASSTLSTAKAQSKDSHSDIFRWHYHLSLGDIAPNRNGPMPKAAETPMIITKLIGGLGNQMFQYAAGLALARRTSHPLRVDTTALRRYNRHQGYQLPEIFSGKFQQASEWELLKTLRLNLKKGTKGSLEIDPNWQMQRGTRLIRQNTHNFWPGFNTLSGPCYLAGYWQSAQYFANAAEEVRSAFTFRTPANAQNKAFTQSIQAANSVSIHIRRGDYVSNPKALKFHGICDWPYYDQAIEIMKERLDNPTFYIFSDDPVLAKSQYPNESQFKVIDINTGADSFRDMELMAQCKHHIIANSSFSWWGAWLGQHARQIVIAPKVWFAGSSEAVCDIYQPNWQRI